MADVEIPETHYARNGAVSIAYRVGGDGPIDVLALTGAISHLDWGSDYEPSVHFAERLAAFGRSVFYDRRGCGLSDRTVDPPTLAEDVADAVAILDDLDIGTAHLFGYIDGGAVALALAAAHPDRVAKVAVFGATCCAVATEDFPWAMDPAEAEAAAGVIETIWGTADLFEAVAGSHATDADMARWWTGMTRAGVSPAGAATWFRARLQVDVRPMLDDVNAPVLVLNRPEAQAVHPGQARYLAEHLPDARHVELPGDANMVMVDTDDILDEVEEFFTGTRPTRTPTRALATVVFTDIVDSTRRAADLGDTAWRAVIARHDDRTRRHVEQHDGKVIKSTGDGAMATFDDPADAIAAARSLIADLREHDLDIRVGLHTGQIEIMDGDVAGIAVHLASRISDLAGSGEIYASRTVKDLVIGSAIEFDDRGTHDLKGIPGTWDILAVADD